MLAHVVDEGAVYSRTCRHGWRKICTVSSARLSNCRSARPVRRRRAAATIFLPAVESVDGGSVRTTALRAAKNKGELHLPEAQTMHKALSDTKGKFRDEAQAECSGIVCVNDKGGRRDSRTPSWALHRAATLVKIRYSDEIPRPGREAPLSAPLIARAARALRYRGRHALRS